MTLVLSIILMTIINDEEIEKEKETYFKQCYFNQACFDHFYIYGKSKYIPPKPKKRKSMVRKKYMYASIIYDHFKKGPFNKMALEITGMSALETGWWKSDFHNERKNFWSRKKVPNGIDCINWEKNCLIRHRNVFHACYEMEAYLIRKGYNQENVEEFLLDLKRKNFAEDPKYIEKVKGTSKKVYNILF